ncbi:hypothetical protein MKW98_027935 [Papaver atlanticum]|uniref:F-box domain-containing protein n=1 Tax=Papaver atlanticum TaxID=357466 RepID=A0AAD4SCB5_9MAGN|nr:hypothetical protein MKW98_027935 [Papaver atlanticum]
MAFLSTLGLGARLIGRRRHHRPQSKVAKTRCKFGFKFKPYGWRRKQMGEGIREKQKRGNDCCDQNEVNVISNTGSSGSSSSIFNPNDDVTIEILSRLPAKSLMRFKCVCKNWFFLIQNDTTFIDLHFKRSKAQPRLLVNNQIDIEKCVLMTFDMFGVRSGGSVSAAAVHTVKEIDSKYDKMLKPVNGLIGFLGETRIDPGVCIYNLSTQEITPWNHEEFKDLAMATCALGYDPSTKEDKVVGIWMSMQPYYTICEVMTVGDNIWRQIDQVPPYNLQLHGSYVYINGLIYYSTVSLTMGRVIDMDKVKFIGVFDVGREDFRTIRVPNYIFVQTADHQAYYVFYYVRLLELEGRQGLLIKLRRSGTLKLWLLDDDENKKNSMNSWTQVTIELPNILEGDVHGVSYDLVSGRNQIILNSYAKTSDGKISGTTYHSYNWKNKSFNKIEISGIPSSVPFFTTESTVETFSEHLLPVQKHTSERN